MSLGAQISRKDYNVYVLIGDGELDEGLIWEAAECAVKYNLDNLISIVDVNSFQSCGGTEEIMPLRDISKKWESFGWKSKEIDGHNFRDIFSALDWAKEKEKIPKVIIAHTIKGKGVSFMETDNSWHQKALTEEQMKIAAKELKN